MYETFYGFKQKPFNLLPDPSFLFLSKKHALALTYLEYGLLEQAGFIVITGEIGSGKTTLLKHLLNNIRASTAKVALVFNTHITPLELLEMIVKEWELKPKERTKVEYYETLNDFFLREYSKKHRVILIIDEAQNLSSETLEELRMLSNVNDEKQPLLHIILAGQPNLRYRLNQENLEQLRQRISVHYHLSALDKDESFEYIRHRLKKTEAPDLEIFSSAAMESIYTHSRGIPRVINIICDTALVYGFAEGLHTIDKSIIESVIADRAKGGLLFFEESPVSASERSGLEETTALNQINELQEQCALFKRSISQLFPADTKLSTIKDSDEAMKYNHSKEPPPREEAEPEQNQQMITAHNPLTNEVSKLLEKVKGLRKSFSRN